MILEAEKDEFYGAIKNCPFIFSSMMWAVSEAPNIFYTRTKSSVKYFLEKTSILRKTSIRLAIPVASMFMPRYHPGHIRVLRPGEVEGFCQFLSTQLASDEDMLKMKNTHMDHWRTDPSYDVLLGVHLAPCAKTCGQYT